jgi:hypothetical protein
VKRTNPDRELLGNALPDRLGEITRTLPQPGFAPDHQAVIFAQTFSFAQIGRPALVQAKKAVGAAHPQQSQQGIRVKPAVSQDQVACLELIEQLLQEVKLVLMLVALDVIEQSAGSQAEHTNQFQHRETAAGFLSAGLRVSKLVFARVGGAGAGTVDDFDTESAPKVADFLGLRGGGAAQA